ncbi:MAG: pseudouridine synthase [Isosphaeraceae bacterium]
MTPTRTVVSRDPSIRFDALPAGPGPFWLACGKIPSPWGSGPLAMSRSVSILLEDAHLLAVAKPAGLLTQGRPTGEPTLEQAVRLHLAPDNPSSVYLGTVHRLDRPVSGVVLWAKTSKAAHRLATQFSMRQVVKEYWAIVETCPASVLAAWDKEPRGVWDDWLANATDEAGVVRVLPPRASGARRAVTRYQFENLQRLHDGMRWLRLWPETGRTHQLRVQAASRGLPVLGDTTYGSERPFPKGIALHARALTLRHPILHGAFTIVAPLPATWREMGLLLPETPGPSRPGVEERG